MLRVAYIHSSEEATQVADARERALATAEDALERMRNGLWVAGTTKRVSRSNVGSGRSSA